MERKIVTVPFVYEISATKDRERTPREVMIAGRAGISLLVADGSEAPIALRYTKLERDVHGRITKREPVELRVAGERFFERTDLTQDMFEDAETGYGARNPLIYKNHILARYRIAWQQFGQLPSSEKDYKVSASSRDKDEQEIQSSADAYLFVGGGVWRECRHPVLELTMGIYQRAWLDVIYVDPRNTFSKLGDGEYFRLDEFENAKEWAQFRFESNAERYGEKITDAQIVERVADLDIVIPEAFTFNPDISDFLAFAGKALKDDEKNVIFQGRAMTTAWHDVADAVNALKEKPADVELHNLIEAIGKLIALKKARLYPSASLINEYEQIAERLTFRSIRDQAPAAAKF